MSNRVNIKHTGKVRYRVGWFGKLILQVEEQYQTYCHEGGGSYSPEFKGWRDAKVEDLVHLKIDVELTDE